MKITISSLPLELNAENELINSKKNNELMDHAFLIQNIHKSKFEEIECDYAEIVLFYNDDKISYSIRPDALKKSCKASIKKIMSDLGF